MPLFVKLPAIPTTAAPNSVNVPLMVTSLPNVIASATDSDNVPPLLIVTAPVKVFVPVALEMANVDALATVVVPVTPNVNPAAVKVAALVPSPTNKFPPIVISTTVAVDAVPPRVKLPAILVVPACKVFVPLPDKVKL